MWPIVSMCSEMGSKIMGTRERKWTARTGMRLFVVDTSAACGARGTLSFRLAYNEDWRGVVIAVVHQLKS